MTRLTFDIFTGIFAGFGLAFILFVLGFFFWPLWLLIIPVILAGFLAGICKTLYEKI